MSLQELEVAVSGLSRDELADFAEWFERFRDQSHAENGLEGLLARVTPENIHGEIPSVVEVGRERVAC